MQKNRRFEKFQQHKMHGYGSWGNWFLSDWQFSELHGFVNKIKIVTNGNIKLWSIYMIYLHLNWNFLRDAKFQVGNDFEVMESEHFFIG